MSKFIEQHKGLLKFYCITARIIGWLLLLMSIVGFVLLMVLIEQKQGVWHVVLNTLNKP